MTIRPIAAALLFAGLAVASPVAAQGTASRTAEPPKDATGSTNTLSDKLEATDGVIRPPANISPDITTKAPVPEPGTTTIVRPGTIPQQPAR